MFLDHILDVTSAHVLKNFSETVAQLLLKQVFVFVCYLLRQNIGLARGVVAKLSMDSVFFLLLHQLAPPLGLGLLSFFVSFDWSNVGWLFEVIQVLEALNQLDFARIKLTQLLLFGS